MVDPADIRFFQALKQVFSTVEANDHAVRNAIDRAIETGDPLDMRAARAALDQLDDELRTDLLRQAHFLMATDVSAIWDMLAGAPSGKGRPN